MKKLKCNETMSSLNWLIQDSVPVRHHLFDVLVPSIMLDCSQVNISTLCHLTWPHKVTNELLAHSSPLGSCVCKLRCVWLCNLQWKNTTSVQLCPRQLTPAPHKWNKVPFCLKAWRVKAKQNYRNQPWNAEKRQQKLLKLSVIVVI